MEFQTQPTCNQLGTDVLITLITPIILCYQNSKPEWTDIEWSPESKDDTFFVAFKLLVPL